VLISGITPLSLLVLQQREDTQEGAMMDESEDTNGMPTIDIRVDVSTPINEEEILSKAVPTSKPTPAKLAKSRVNENNASSRPPSSTITSPPRSTSTKPSSNEVSGMPLGNTFSLALSFSWGCRDSRLERCSGEIQHPEVRRSCPSSSWSAQHVQTVLTLRRQRFSDLSC